MRVEWLRVMGLCRHAYILSFSGGKKLDIFGNFWRLGWKKIYKHRLHTFAFSHAFTREDHCGCLHNGYYNTGKLQNKKLEAKTAWHCRAEGERTPMADALWLCWHMYIYCQCPTACPSGRSRTYTVACVLAQHFLDKCVLCPKMEHTGPDASSEPFRMFSSCILSCDHSIFSILSERLIMNMMEVFG